jgi:uncharacterized protein (DUF1684 family)
VILVLLAPGCTSGPAPIDDRPYAQQLQAWRAQKDADLRSANDSPIPMTDRASFAGLTYYAVDPAYRVPALFTADPTGPPVTIELQTSQNGRQPMRRVGTLGFTLHGTPHKLSAFADVAARQVDRLFVPFGDLTNGSETYQGGRFLDLERTPTGLYDLDFNRAYLPYCVYNHSWECPIPPRENRLAIAIRAGERLGQ